MAWVFAFESMSFMVRRKIMRHSVTISVNAIYAANVMKMIIENQMSYREI